MIDHLNDEERTKFYNMVKECLNSDFRKSAETEFKKEVINRAADELGVDKKKMRKVVSIMYKDSLDKEREELDEIENVINQMQQ